MTAATTNISRNTPTVESIQEALAFLKTLAERKSTADDTGKSDLDSFLSSDIFKTIEAALKSTAEAKSTAAPVEEYNSEEEDENDHQKRHTCVAPQDDEGEEDEDIDTDDDDDDDNPFAGEYYWNPGPEWKTIGLVAGGAALIGLGALLYKLFDD